MRALALEHLHSNPVGLYGDALLDHGIEVRRVRLDLAWDPSCWRPRLSGLAFQHECRMRVTMRV
jgi:hypothetical protein